MLNFDRMRILNEIARRGSVNAAATAMNITNSAVSQQIAKFEVELGQPLLERIGRGVRLTAAATVLVEHTQRMLLLMNRAEADFDAQRNNVFGQITVAAFPTAARGLAPQALRSLALIYPQLKVTMKEQDPPTALPLLARGEVDLVIAQDWENIPLQQPEGLSKAGLMDDIADVAMHVSNPLARRDIVALDELSSERWITWGRVGSMFSEINIPTGWCDNWLVNTLRARGHEPVIAHTAAEHATQFALVAAGLGVCLNPRLGRDPLPPGVCIVAVKPALRRHVYALWRTANPRQRAIEAAVETFRSSAADIVRPQIATPRKKGRSRHGRTT